MDVATAIVTDYKTVEVRYVEDLAEVVKKEMTKTGYLPTGVLSFDDDCSRNVFKTPKFVQVMYQYSNRDSNDILDYGVFFSELGGGPAPQLEDGWEFLRNVGQYCSGRVFYAAVKPRQPGLFDLTFENLTNITVWFSGSPRDVWDVATTPGGSLSATIHLDDTATIRKCVDGMDDETKIYSAGDSVPPAYANLRTRLPSYRHLWCKGADGKNVVIEDSFHIWFRQGEKCNSVYYDAEMGRRFAQEYACGYGTSSQALLEAIVRGLPLTA